MKLWSRFVVSLLCSLASPALAQTYVVSTGTAPFVPLVGGTKATLALPNNIDDNRAQVPIGFDFPFFDKTYSTVFVSTNGLAYFTSDCPNGCAYSANEALLTASNPNGVIAPFWDDLRLANEDSAITYRNSTDANGGVLTVEWSNFDFYRTSSATGTPHALTFQMILHQNGFIEFHYGPQTIGTVELSAGIGLKSPAGAVFFGDPCTQEKLQCTSANFIPNRVLRFRPPLRADLLGLGVEVNWISSGTTVTFNATTRFRNWGETAANNVRYRLFLSSDRVISADDVPLNPAPLGPWTVAPLATVNHTATVVADKPASSAWWVLAQIDSEGAVAEESETNNTTSSAASWAAGVDLVPKVIEGPTASGPTEQVTVHVEFQNRGMTSAGSFPFRILLSYNTSYSPDDVEIYSATEDILISGQTVKRDLTFRMPRTILDGDYYYLLQLDNGPAPGNVVELSEYNNILAGQTSKLTFRRADLVLEPVVVRNASPPNQVAEVAFFNEPVQLDVRVANVGGATARFSTLLYLSDNDALNAFSDPLLEEVGSLTLGPGESRLITVTPTLPSKGLNNADYRPGDFYFFAVASTRDDLPEISTNNNTSVSKPQKVRGPGPDLLPTSLDGPSEVGAGEVFVVSRTIRNAGLRAAPATSYRYYLSANPQISPEDIPLLIDLGQEVKTEGMVALAAGAVDTQIERIRVPPTVGAATYYLGILVDPPSAEGGSGALLEVNESNNGLATQVINVVSQALQIHGSFLPDSIQGLPYEYWLSAKGGKGSYAYALRAEGGTLPDGLVLDPDGRIHGTPTGSGSKAFTVRVESGGQIAQARLVLKTVPLTTSLTITTRQLPALVRGIPFEVFFSALGGQGPYLWTKETGALPPGFNLTESGRLMGATTAALGATFRFSLRVKDAVGNSDLRAFEMTVIDATTLTIATDTLISGVVGRPYVADVVASSAGGVALPLTWKMANGSLPPGVVLEPEDEVLMLSGTPTTSGNFLFSLEAVDGKGRAATASFVIQVLTKPAQISGALPASLTLGQTVELQLQVKDFSAARFSVYSGLLPPGLMLSPGGLLAGTIPPEGVPGRYTFSVSAIAPDGSSALASFATDVTPAPRRGGCMSADGAAWLALWVLVPLLRKLRGMS